MADGAGLFGLVARHLLAHPDAIGFAPATFQIAQHALERLRHGISAQAILVGERDLLIAGAVQDRVACLLRQLEPRRAHRNLQVLREALQRLVVVRALRAGPRRDGTLGETFAFVGNDQVRIEEAFHAEAVAGRASAVRAVEAEQARLDFLDREAAHRTGEAAGKHGPLTAIGVLDIGHAIGHRQRGFEAVGQARGDALAYHDAVDHRFDLMLGLAVERRHLADLVQLAVHLHAREAAALQLGEFLAVFALAVAHHGRQQQQARAVSHGQHAIDHLADGLRLDRQAGGGRVGHADARPEQAHVIVDFRHRADRGAWVAAGGLLLDGNRRRQALDGVDVGLAHQFEELAGIGGQAFDVTALALGVDGVERQRRFAGAGQAGNDGQAVARDIDIDILQIMFARAAHSDGGSHAKGSPESDLRSTSVLLIWPVRRYLGRRGRPPPWFPEQGGSRLRHMVQWRREREIRQWRAA